MEVRRNNLPAVADTAAPRRTPAQLRQLEKAFRHRAVSSVMARDRGVHRIIARSSGNVLNILLINFFEDLCDAFGPLYFDNPDTAGVRNNFTMTSTRPSPSRLPVRPVISCAKFSSTPKPPSWRPCRPTLGRAGEQGLKPKANDLFGRTAIAPKR